MQTVDVKSETDGSYLAHGKIHLPAEVTLHEYQRLYYRAAVTHATLHLMNPVSPFEVADLNMIQRSIIGLIEDLRVELQAINLFPGLRQLWLEFHRHITVDTHASATDLMARLSRSVLDPGYVDRHGWVCKGRTLLLNNDVDLSNPALALEIGLPLANDIGQMRLTLNTGRNEQNILYRDDNRCLWQDTSEQLQQVETVIANDTSIAPGHMLREQDYGATLAFT